MEQQLKSCHKCNYNWLGRVEDPKECPYCKSYKWKGGLRYNRESKEPEQQEDFLQEEYQGPEIYEEQEQPIGEHQSPKNTFKIIGAEDI